MIHRTTSSKFCSLLVAMAGLAITGQQASAGTWTKLTNLAPGNVVLMLLLSDGTVMAHNGYTGSGYGNAWYRLTPAANGSYATGTWTTRASSAYTRLWYGSQVLQDGRVFVAGGEYGTGTARAEVYNPVTNAWTTVNPPTTLLDPSQTSPVTGSAQCFYDSNSEILPNGNVLIMPVQPKVAAQPLIYNPNTNAWSAANKLFRGVYMDEATWVKLPDDTIVTIDPFGTNSERYNPASGTWINDSNVPVSLYDSFGSEMGGGLSLPNGKVFMIGATVNTALYTLFPRLAFVCHSKLDPFHHNTLKGDREKAL